MGAPFTYGKDVRRVSRCSDTTSAAVPEKMKLDWQGFGIACNKGWEIEARKEEKESRQRSAW